MKVLWFCDAHICPNDDLTRFVALGNYIVAEKPDYVVQGGDFMTLDSFSRWDQNKRLKIEGRRYAHEISVGNEALKCIYTPIVKYNQVRAKNKEKQYKPKWIWIQGNHDYWPDQYVERNPELHGIIDIRKDLYIDFLPGKVVYVPFVSDKWYYNINGVSFCHVPRNRAGPVSSKYMADKAVELFNNSVVFGHTHRLLCSTIKRAGSDEIIQSLNGGCFFERDPEYSVGNTNDYWRGIILLNIVNAGVFDFSTISLEKLKGEYL